MSKDVKWKKFVKFILSVRYAVVGAEHREHKLCYSSLERLVLRQRYLLNSQDTDDNSINGPTEASASIERHDVKLNGIFE